MGGRDHDLEKQDLVALPEAPITSLMIDGRAMIACNRKVLDIGPFAFDLAKV